MNEEAAFQQAMLANPNDLALRLVFADWLEERGDLRGELLRLTHTLTQSIDVPQRAELEARLQSLVDEGVQAVGPFWTNSIGMRFAWVPSGTFLMGSPENETHHAPNEKQHRVILTKGFFMGLHLVTQAEWQNVMGNNPSCFKFKSEELLPVESVSWKECKAFCRKLSARDGKTYRLPTEAEWEYACRTGTTTLYCFGEVDCYVDPPDKLADYAWNGKNAKDGPHPVGQKKPNAWGLHDMHGNVREWCSDRYRDYSSKEVTDPIGPSKGNWRVVRGGSFDTRYECCHAADRWPVALGYRELDLGLRVCFLPD